MTPKEYLVRIRLSRAADLLENSSCTVTETARSVGYDDVYNFSKIFKKSTESVLPITGSKLLP